MFFKKIQDKAICFEEPGTGIERSLDTNIITNEKFKSDAEAEEFALRCEYLDTGYIDVILNYFKNNVPEASLTLDDLKEIKMRHLAELARDIMANGTYADVPGVGRVNAGAVFIINLEALIDIAKKTSKTKVQFRMYNNEIKELTIEELELCKLAIQQRGLQIYHNKWVVENKIKSAPTKLDLDEIKLEL